MIIHSPIFSGSINQAESAYANLSGSFSGSFTGVGNFVGLEADSVAYSNVTGKPSLVSGSSQISYPQLSNIPSGIISSSAQIDTLFNIDGLISGSSQVSYPGLSNIPAGIVSGSAQVTPLLPTGVVSGSGQINVASTTGDIALGTRTSGNYVATITAGNGIVSSGATTGEGIAHTLSVGGGVVSGSSQITYANISSIPAGIVSGSAQVTPLLPAGTVSGSSQIVGILSSLNSYTSSNDTTNTTQNSRLNQLSTYTGSNDTTNTTQNNRLTSLETASGSAISRLNVLEIEALNLELYTASNDTTNTTQNSRLNQLSTASGSAIGRLNNLELTSASLLVETSNLESFTSSQESKNSTLATYTGSNDTKWDTLGSLSGSFARTNSANTFSGTQVVSGSLTVTQDFVVLGSSSIQNVSSSVLNIGTNLITVAVNQPSVRFGGLAVIDSGSEGQSGSFLYDSVQDEFIFLHRGDGTNITSSHFVLGPETYNNLGNEIYLTNNRVSKGTGKEHLVDSNITDNGTTITLGSNTVVTGTIVASGTALVSGSSQITYSGISSIPAGIVSGSSQVTPLLPTGVVSGSSQVIYTSLSSIPAGIVSGSSQVVGILGSLNSYTASNDTTNTTQNSRLDQLSTASGSAITRLNLLEVETANLEIFSGSALNRLGVLEVETSNLEAFTGSINTTIKTQLNVNTVVSGSSQVVYTSLSSIPAGIVSGSSQVAIASTSGFGTWINQAVLTSSDVQFAKLGVGGASDATYELRVVGDIGATGDIVAYVSSDARLKNNVELISNPIEKVQALRGVTWEWNELASDAAKQSPNVGVIAQEVENVLPQLVHDRENGFKGVDYAKLTGLLIEAIKEQQKQIDELKSKL